MAKRPRKPSKAYLAPSEAAERRMQQALHDYDEAVTKMEMKWGVDRLPWLAGQDLRERFEAQMDKLNKAIDDRVDVEHQVDVTKRGLAALEQAAINNGHEQLSGDYIEAVMPDGKVLAVVRTSYDVAKVKRENRDLVVYSAEELAMMIAKMAADKAPLLEIVKDTFPGAVIEDIKPKTDMDEILNDTIPF